MARRSEEPPSQPASKWVDPGIPETRVDICQVLSSREETMLLFGTRLAPFAGRRARLDRRIVLSPLLAKQLAASLKSMVRALETPLDSENATPAGNIRSAPSEEDAPAAARPLLGLVKALNVGFGFEKSFKMTAGNLLDERMILGVRSKLPDAQSLLRICRQIGMPPVHLALFEESLPEANTVGFGFEGDPGGGGIFKVYLEFWERLRQRVQVSARPDLLFLGFKWDARDSTRSALARYTCYPLLSVAGILRRLDALYEGRSDTPSLEATREIVRLAARTVGNDSFVYVEAAEEGNPRKSFDINFYKAGLTVDQLRPALSALGQSYSIAAQQLEAIAAQAADCPFGHLSGGLGRDAKDFLTVYYELEGL